MKKTLPYFMLFAVVVVVALNSGHAQQGHHQGAGTSADDGMPHQSHAQGMHGSGSGEARGELPRVRSEVRRINTRANTLSLRHGEIPNLGMPPMTMVFQVSDPSLLEGLGAGDEILATFDRINGAYTVLSVEPMQ